MPPKGIGEQTGNPFAGKKTAKKVAKPTATKKTPIKTAKKKKR
jgi:hypothetical protein